MNLIVLFISAFTLFALQKYIYHRYWDYRLSVSIQFQSKPVLEGETAVLTEVIENHKILPLIYLNVKFQISKYLHFQTMENTSISDHTYKNDIFSILFFQRITRTLTFDCQKRGYYEIKQADLISSNLLMTDRLIKVIPTFSYLYVYPKAIDISKLEIPFSNIIGSLTSHQFLYEDPFEFRGLRNYTITDPMNQINWKASARSGNLMVNLHDSTSSQEVVILLNLEDESVWKQEFLQEVSIRLASAISQRFLKISIPTKVLSNAYDILTGQTVHLPYGTGLRQINQIQEALARIDLSRPADSCSIQIQELQKTRTSSVPFYIMISYNMKKELQAEFYDLICNHTGGLWIAPLTDDMEFTPSSTIPMLRWEVSRYEK